MNEINSRRRGRVNWLLLLSLGMICGLGLYNLYSASRSAIDNLALVQGIWMAGCLVLALAGSFIDYRLFERLAYPLFLAALLSLLAVLGIGKVINNSKRWIDLGLFNFQPSEIMKIGIILALAKYFSDDADQVRQQSTISRILVFLHPFYPLTMLAAVLVLWRHPPFDEWGQNRYFIAVGLACWTLLAAYFTFLKFRGPGRAATAPAPGARQKSYSLDDLIKPATPFYPLGAAGALILFWEKSPLAEAGNLRFVLLGLCLIWAAVSLLMVFRSGKTSLHDLLSPVILVFLPAILIIRQPDLGTSLVLCATAASMILFMRVRFASFVIAVAVLAVAVVASWYVVLKPYQQDRIKAFMAPSADTMDSGYHARQSIIAVGSGQMTGKGFGRSTQTRFQFLPEQHTDFVFSVWAEEQGFAGSIVALVLFLFLLVQVVNVASAAKDRFGVLLCVGLASLLFWHVFINIGMVIGALPVVGLTLPFWSYGGSSVLAFMAGFGLVLSVSMHRSSY